MLYYDKISMLRSDFESTVTNGSTSSYHNAISKRISHLATCKDVDFELIDTYEVLEKEGSLREEAKKIRAMLIERALDPNCKDIEKHTVFYVLESSFRSWMDFNMRKLSFLSKQEPLYKYLCENPKNFAAWRTRERDLQEWRITASTMSSEQFTYICEKLIGGALLRLIETSLQYIILMQAGLHIYDPLLYSYLPAIETLKSGSFSKCIHDETESISNTFYLLCCREARRTYFLPPHLKGDDLSRAIEKHELVRKKMNQLDKTLASIKNEDLIYSLKDVIEETNSIVFSIKKISEALELGSWFVGLLSTSLSLVLNPLFISKTREYIANKLLRINPYGSFAGRYADITSSIIKEQQIFHDSKNLSFELKTSLLDKHYAPPC